MKFKTILSTLAMAAVVLLAGCSEDENTNVSPSPTVSINEPADNATNVALSAIITATFSDTMNPSTINTSTFTVKQGDTNIAGTVSYTGSTASFVPSVPLKQNTTYTVTISTGIKNTIGEALENNYTYSFTTVVVPDNTLPIINSTFPLDNDTNVAQNKLIAVDFSEKMDATTINDLTFTLKQGNTVVPGTVNYTGTTATFTPTNVMDAGTTYIALLTKDAKDLAGNALAADKEWSFSTEEAPLINSISPLNNATNVERVALISVIFNKIMDASTINASTFTFKQGNTVIPGAISYSGKTAIFNPTNALAANTIYTVLITNGAKDIAGNALASDIEWSFTTIIASANQAIVNLGTAGNYVILAKTAITNVPYSDITGDLGLSPAATSYITGFELTDFTGYATDPKITGKVYAANMADPTPINLTTAVENMITAYTDAAGRPTADFLNLGTGNLGGKTLTPGLYKFTSSVTLPTDVTISGGPNDVWIFQISDNLNISTNVKVTLAGGAQAKNIFWQVAGEAVFGATSHFEGIILSWTGITFQTSATFKGRALAGTAVILDTNTVVGPN